MLKADLHLHTNVDPEDTFITHSPFDLIEHAAALGFDVLSLTHHRQVIFERKWEVFAKKRRILLIPGTEARIEGKDVLLYNFLPKEVKKIEQFEDLARFAKRKDRLIVVPHPFYPIPSVRHVTHSAGWSMRRLAQYVDAIEYCHLYGRGLNVLNRRAERLAEVYGLPVVANSDSHALGYMGSNYTLVDAKPSIREVFAAIRHGLVKVVSRPRSAKELVRLTWHLLSPAVLKKLALT